ncbi:MAG TPA: type II secretion system protein [Burkholderiaceae bacterium]|nr:type II secretion system protein [Burkholderiaceae bacterium]
MKKSQSGFTLVEIAIVLVIVGLLLGAVLKGQELIFNTRVKSTFSMSRELTAAISAYQDRYRALPGDDGQAATRFPSAAVVPTNGDSNGVIRYVLNPCAAGVQAGENCQAFYHLRLGGFISGTGSESPKTAFSTNVHLAQMNSFITGAASSPGMALDANGITHKIMSAIDNSFDDGSPATGSVRCQNLTTYNMATPDNGIGVWCVLAL